MNDYWGMPEKEYELSLMQFAKDQLNEKGYSIMDEKVEVCGGAGAMTLTGILKTKEELLGIYIHDGPKQRKTRGPPIIKALHLLPEMKNVNDLRSFILTHPDFYSILSFREKEKKRMIEDDIRKIYAYIYKLKIVDLYKSDLSSAADALRVRLRKVNESELNVEC